MDASTYSSGASIIRDAGGTPKARAAATSCLRNGRVPLQPFHRVIVERLTTRPVAMDSSSSDISESSNAFRSALTSTTCGRYLVLFDIFTSLFVIPQFDKVIDIVPAMVSGAVSTSFFRSGHKAPRLQDAYAKARSARFEFEDQEQRRSA